jgi:hypothetical protein
MIKSILLIATLLFTTASHAQWWGNKKIKGNGNMATETRSTRDYDGVKCAGSGDMEIVSHQSLKARVSGSGDIEYKGNPSKEDTKVSGSGSISN